MLFAQPVLAQRVVFVTPENNMSTPPIQLGCRLHELQVDTEDTLAACSVLYVAWVHT